MHNVTNPIIREELKQICSHIEEVLRHVFESFRTEKISFAESANHQLSNLQDYLEKWAEESESKESSVVIKNQIKEIYEYIEKLIQQALTRIKQHAVFSEKALQEIEYLVGSVKYLLRCLGDVAVTGNPTLVKYIIETSASLADSADKFIREHEDRLIAGLCTTQAEPLYEEIMLALKEIICRIRVIVQWVNRI